MSETLKVTTYHEYDIPAISGDVFRTLSIDDYCEIYAKPAIAAGLARPPIFLQTISTDGPQRDDL